MTSDGAVKSEIVKNKKLAKNLNKPIIRKFEKSKVHSFFIDNTWGVIWHSIKGFGILWSATDIYSKYVEVIPLKEKKGILVTNAVQKF